MVEPVFLFLAVAALSVVVSSAPVQRAARFLKLAEFSSSGLLFLWLGAALGPGGSGALPAATLPSLAPLVALGLGLVGVLVGMNLDPRVLRLVPARAQLAAAGECAVTFVAVALPLIPFVAGLLPGPLANAVGAAALLGAAACVSSGHLAEAAMRAGRIPRESGVSLSVLAMLHDGVALAALACALALSTGAFSWHGVELVGRALMLGALFGLLWAFLIRSTPSGSELLAVALGSVALVSGFAAWLRLSTLLAAVACGAVLAFVGGRRAAEVFRLMLRIERPAYMILLFVIGAHVDPRDRIAWVLTLAFVVLRAIGKLAGGRVARSLAGPALRLPEVPGLALLAQGAIALCIAIEYRVMAPGEASRLLLDVMAAGVLANELLGRALFARAWRPADARVG